MRRRRVDVEGNRRRECGILGGMLVTRVLRRPVALVFCAALAVTGCSGNEGGGGSGGGGGVAGSSGTGGTAGSGTGGGASGGSAGTSTGGAAGSGSGGMAGAGGSSGTTALGCPPAPPYGTQVGDLAPDVTLYDCDGNAVQLHSLCAHQAAAVYTFAIWCPVCKAHMDNGEPQALYAQYQNDDFDMFVVVTQTATGALPDETHCVATRDAYNLKMPVLVDKDGALEKTLGLSVNSGALALSHGAKIELLQSYGFDALSQKLPELLGK